MIVSLIAAVAANGVIGRDNDLVWNLPDDMKFFQSTTRGHHVIMGRKNYESLPKKWSPLPGRTNIVVTRQQDLALNGFEIVNSVEEGIDLARENNETEVFVIGGGQIYELAMDLADKIYYTKVYAEVAGDTYFPTLDFSRWKEIKRRHHPADDRHEYAFDFIEYVRT